MSNQTTKYLAPMRWFDLQKEVIKRPELGQLPGAEDSSQTGSNSWCGASWYDAMNMMQNGWLEGASRVEALLDKVDISEASEPAWNIEAAGFFPCVPAYLAGDPECMWQRVDGEIMKPRLCLIANAVYPASISSDEILVYGMALAAVTRALEASGADAAIYSLDVTSAYGDGNISQAFIVRDFGQPVDTSTIAFAFHPAFLRRALFAHRELGKDWVDMGVARSGYGQAVDVTREHARGALGDLSAAIAIMPSPQELQRRGMLEESRIHDLIAEFREVVETAKKEITI